jgi:signal transduction histidine kinase
MVGQGSQAGRQPVAPLARLSMRQKLPLMTGGLLLLLAVALAWAAYAQVRRVVLAAASQRVQAVSQQLGDMLRVQGDQLARRVDTLAQDAALRRYLQAPGERTRRAALAALRHGGPQPEQVVAVELRDDRGRRVLATGPGGERVAGLEATPFPRPAPGDAGAIGEFRRLRDAIVYAAAARVPGPAGGYLVQWRRLTGTAQSRLQIAGLIGSSARLYLGNADGSLWTDLVGAVAAPPVPRGPPGRVGAVEQPDSGVQLVSARPIPGTPWMVLVAFARAPVLAPVYAFLRGLALITLGVLALGLGATWLLSRRITRPLRQLTDAAHAIAAGDFSRRVTVARADELGRLAESFDTMAARVEEAQHRLEDKVAERTRELRDAQDALVRREKLAMLGQLASGVGHELRNPLGVMTNAIYYLETVQGSAPAEVQEYLQILRQQVALSEKIVSDLLDFARIRPPQRRAMTLGSLAEAQLKRLGTPEGIAMRLDVPHELPAAAVDPVQIGQVVFNLLANAVQAMMETGGELVLRGVRDGPGQVMLHVSDTGPGVPPEHAEKIFEPLFTTKARGIGLGLAVSRSLARANGGDLILAGSGGPGATFVLSLPTA